MKQDIPELKQRRFGSGVVAGRVSAPGSGGLRTPGFRRLAGMLAFAALLVAALGWTPVAVRADDDHDRARQALLAGKVMSLRDVLDKVAVDYPGEPVEIEFEEDDGHFEYEIKLLQPAGNIIKLKVDAASGEVIGLKGRGVQFKEKK